MRAKNSRRSTLIHRITVVGLGLVLALLPILGTYTPVQAAFVSIEVVSVDGITAPSGERPSIAVTSGAAIDVAVRVQISGSTAWRSIVYEWDDSTPDPPPGGGTCVNITDHTTPGIYVETLNNVPTTGLTTNRRHTLYVQAYETDNCTGTGSGTGAVLPNGFPEGSTTIFVTSLALTPNPDLSQSCGIRVILVLDESGSIVGLGPGASNISADVRSGAQSLVAELQGTGTEIAVIEFNGTGRRAIVGGTTAYQTINAGYVTAFNTYLYNGIGGGPSNAFYDPEDYSYPFYYTNWQSALYQVIQIGNASGYPPLVVFFTDGNPTAVGNTSVSVVGTDDDDEDISVTAAIPNANTIRNANSHIFFVGTPNPSLDKQTVIAVSGPDQYPVPDGSVGTADFTGATAEEFAAGLKQLVTQLCGATVDVFKYVDDTNSAAVGNPLAPGFDPNWATNTGWAMEGNPTLNVTGGPNDFTWTTPDDTAAPADVVQADTDAQGRVRFSWQYVPVQLSGAQSSVIVEELPDPGVQTDEYYLKQITCSNPDGGTFTPSTTNDKQFTLSNLNQSSVARCEYFNARKPLVAIGAVCGADNPNSNTAVVIAGMTNDDTLAQATRVSGSALFTVTLPSGVLQNDLYAFTDPLDYIPAVTNIPGGTVACQLVATPAPVHVVCVLENGSGTPIPLPPGGIFEAIITIDQVFPSDSPSQVQPLVDGGFDLPTRYVDGSTSICNQTTPITLGRFASGQDGGSTRFEWTTSTEVANAGFNLYAGDDPANLTQLNAEFLVSAVVDSMEPTDYSVSVPSGSIPGQTVYLEEVGVAGVTRLHGPYQIGQVYGERPAPTPIDWAAVAAESDALDAQRTAADSRVVAAAAAELATVSGAGQANAPFAPQYGNILWDDETSSENDVLLPLVASPFSSGSDSESPLTPEYVPGPRLAELRVEETGICRVTHADLVAGGVDAGGIDASSLAVINDGEPIEIFVHSQSSFGDGAYIEFFCEGVDTRYTKTNVYYLEVNPDAAERIVSDERAIADGAVAPVAYTESIHLEENTDIVRTPPYGEEGWFWSRLYWPGNATLPNWTTKSFVVDNHVPEAGPASVDAEVWGSADRYCNPDHFFDLEINGELALSDSFDGLTVHKASVSGANLQDGDNTVTLRLKQTCDGLRYDFLYLNDVDVQYPRAFSAYDGSYLSFVAAGEKFTVGNLSTDEVTVYRLDAEDGSSSLTRLAGFVESAGDGTFTVSFRGATDGTEHQYFVMSQDARITPQVAPAHTPGDLIVDGDVDLLMISHPDFMIALGPLQSHREYQGFSTLLVNVEDVYQVYGNGIFGPDAIRAYIADAVAEMGVEYVLLGGGDTVDYLDYKNLGSISFIPSYYEFYPSDGVFLSSPADPLLVDIEDTNGDGVIDGNRIPNLALGRLPFRTTSEAARLVQKYLDYDNKDYAQRAVFTADAYDSQLSLDFTVPNERFIARLPDGWSYETAYVDEVGASDARETVMAAINGGVAWANFAGHSDEGFWGRPSILTTADVETLTNAGRPTVVSQWGCFTNSYANPSSNTMALEFLVGGDYGAAAVLGTTTRSNPTHSTLLDEKLAPYVTQPGMTLGQAVQQAKEDLSVRYPFVYDVLSGMTILGDPTMMVQP